MSRYHRHDWEAAEHYRNACTAYRGVTFMPITVQR